MRATLGHASIILVMLSFAAPVSAQYSILLPDGTCQPVDTMTGLCDSGSCSSSLTCRPVRAGVYVCIPRRAVFCVDDSATGGECPEGRTRRRAFERSIDVCLPDGFDLCDASIDPIDCFTSPEGEGPIDLLDGDCDLDTIPNGEDSAPCERGPDVAFASPDGYCDLAEPCGTDVGCPPDTFCQTADSLDPHTYCLPPDDSRAFCCGGTDDVACPDGDPCLRARPEDHGFCPDIRYCAGWSFLDRIACITGEDGSFPVDPELGNCDGDEDLNGMDSTPCGEPMVDAGMPRDGGAMSMDAGSPPEPPADVVPMFNGGGGCVCRATPDDRSGSIAWLVGLLALMAVRRRR